jgi:hypothetical protein
MLLSCVKWVQYMDKRNGFMITFLPNVVFFAEKTETKISEIWDSHRGIYEDSYVRFQVTT